MSWGKRNIEKFADLKKQIRKRKIYLTFQFVQLLVLIICTPHLNLFAFQLSSLQLEGLPQVAGTSAHSCHSLSAKDFFLIKKLSFSLIFTTRDSHMRKRQQFTPNYSTTVARKMFAHKRSQAAGTSFHSHFNPWLPECGFTLLYLRRNSKPLHWKAMLVYYCLTEIRQREKRNSCHNGKKRCNVVSFSSFVVAEMDKKLSSRETVSTLHP